MPLPSVAAHVSADLPAGLASLLNAFSADRRLYDLEAGGELGELLVESWSLNEALSTPWELRLNALSPRADLDVDAMLGQKLTLLTALADGSRSPRSGIVTDAAALDADGGLTRYTLSVQPWLALLGYSRRSQLWQDRSLVQIIESVFAAYPLQAAWRWAADTAAHLAASAFSNAQGLRSTTTQYRETDLAFVQRLLTEEGLVYRFEADESAPLGHRLVLLADTPGADSCPADPISAAGSPAALGIRPGIRFHRASSIEQQDAIQAFGGERRLQPATSTVLAWDYKAKKAVATSVPTAADFGGKNAPRLESYDPSSPYAYPSSAQAERAAVLAQQALEARHKRWLGRGTVRTFTSGSTFVLTDSTLDIPRLPAQFEPGAASDDRAKTFLLLSITHAGINNLPKDLRSAAGRLSGSIFTSSSATSAGPSSRPSAADLLAPWVDAALRKQAEASGYANRFEAIRAHVPWRPVGVDESGLRLNPKPTAPGPQTATVVGPDGQSQASGSEEIHTDALGRIRVQFHFQRAAGQGGPQMGPETSPASTWVRVVQRYAGAGMGLQFIPRIGQEVLVDFIEGDIDRPLVIGALYDGKGEAGTPATPGGRAAGGETSEQASGQASGAASEQTSAFNQSTDHTPGAQGNLVGQGAGGHSPAWHGAASAELGAGGQRNAAALSGIKTKEFGGPGHNQLVFDDSDQQLRTQLATTQHASQLNLGHLIHQADNHRGSFRGLGFELRTDAYGSLRARSGLLLTSYATQPAEPAGDNAAGIALANQLQQLAQTFSSAARTHQTVQLAGHIGATQADRSSLSADEAPLKALHTALKGMVSDQGLDPARADAGDKATATGQGKIPHPTDPVLAISAKAGLAVVAGQDIQLAAGEGITLAAGRDSHWAVGGAARLHTGQAIGILAGAIKPGSEAAGTGLTLIAAKDDVEIQAQASTLQVAARNDVSVQSRSTKVDGAAAKKITLATAGGANITIEGGNITVQCPGTIRIRAATKSFVGPQTYAQSMNAMPDKSVLDEDMRLAWPFDDSPVVDRKFEMVRGDGTVIRGQTDATGATGLQKSDFLEALQLKILPES